MTGKEREDLRIAWVKTLKAGDEVCINNTSETMWRFIDSMFGSFLGTKDTQGDSVVEDVCVFGTVYSVLPEGELVIKYENELVLFSAEGKPPGEGPSFDTRPKLWEPSDELKELAHRLTFMRQIKSSGIQWRAFSSEAVQQIITIINSETTRIKEEAAEKQRQFDEEKQKREEEKKASGSGITLARKGVFQQEFTSIPQQMIQHRDSCENCANYQAKGTEFKPEPEPKNEQEG